MQKNENQNRWAPIVVGITEPYPGLYLHPWAPRGESYTVFFSEQEQRQKVNKTVAAICLLVPVYRAVQMVISFLDRRNECNGLHLNLSLNCGFLVFLFIARFRILYHRLLYERCPNVCNRLWYFSNIISNC